MKSVNLRVSEELHAALVSHAVSQRRTMSDSVRLLLETALRREGGFGDPGAAPRAGAGRARPGGGAGPGPGAGGPGPVRGAPVPADREEPPDEDDLGPDADEPENPADSLRAATDLARDLGPKIPAALANLADDLGLIPASDLPVPPKPDPGLQTRLAQAVQQAQANTARPFRPYTKTEQLKRGPHK